jgi:hypothetical protein
VKSLKRNLLVDPSIFSDYPKTSPSELKHKRRPMLSIKPILKGIEEAQHSLRLARIAIKEARSREEDSL